MRSIMHDKRDGTCYLCMAAGDYSRQTCLEEHHCIHGTANRRLSERWGLKVYLCPAHHRHLHDDKDGRIADIYCQIAAERAFREKYPKKDFRAIFGKNIDTEALPSGSKEGCGAAGRQQAQEDNAGFHLLDAVEEVPF